MTHHRSSYELAIHTTSTRSGEGACPMTVMYWDFVTRHEKMLANNPRTIMITRNLQRFSADERAAIRKMAEEMRDRPDSL